MSARWKPDDNHDREMQDLFDEELFDEDLDLAIEDELQEEMFVDEGMDYDCYTGPSIMGRSKRHMLKKRKYILEKAAAITAGIITAAILIKVLKARD